MPDQENILQWLARTGFSPIRPVENVTRRLATAIDDRPSPPAPDAPTPQGILDFLKTFSIKPVKSHK